MTDNENTIVETENTYQDYIDEIKKLKEESVPRDKYEAVLQEKKALLNDLVNGTGNYVAEEPAAKRETIEELRARVYDNPKNDVEYVAGVLELRKRIMDEGGADPFVAENSHYSPTNEDYEIAAQTAEGLQHCVDVAEGDNTIFLNELARITKDTPIAPNKPNKRR